MTRPNNLTILADSSLLITGDYSDYNLIAGQNISKWYAVKFDTDLNIIWELSAPFDELDMASSKLFDGIKLENDKYLLLGSYSPQPANSLDYTEADFLTILVDENNSIKDQARLSNIIISPNPTDATSTLTLDLETAGNLHITLSNTLGQSLLEIHNAFTNAGVFSKTFSVATLPTGIYYVKIIHNGEVKVEKVIRK